VSYNAAVHTMNRCIAMPGVCLSVGLEEAATTSAGRLCGQQPDASAKPRGVHGMRTAANKNIVLTAAGASRLTINCARVSSAAVTVLL